MAIADTVDGLCLSRPGERHGLGSQAQAELLWSTPTRLLQTQGQRQGGRSPALFLGEMGVCEQEFPDPPMIHSTCVEGAKAPGM